MRSIFLKIGSFVSETLNRPLKVLLVCAALIFVNLILEGSLLRLWSLHREKDGLVKKQAELRQESHELSLKLEKASDPSFLEREARDRFDLVSEGDLVFVFSDGD
jgi:cell division protein FtsB